MRDLKEGALRGLGFAASERARFAALVAAKTSAAFERRGNNLKPSKDFYLKAKARIWPCLSYLYFYLKAKAIA